MDGKVRDIDVGLCVFVVYFHRLQDVVLVGVLDTATVGDVLPPPGFDAGLRERREKLVSVRSS